MRGHEMWGSQGEENECSLVFKLRTETGTVNTRILMRILGMSVEFQTATILPAPLIIRCKNKEMSESKLWNAPECSVRSDRRAHRRLQVSTKLLKDNLAKKDKMHKSLGAFEKLKRLLLLHACPSVRMEQLGSHWTNCNELWYLSIFWNSVEKIQLSLRFYKNNAYFTWRPIYIFDHISPNFRQMENCFRQKL